MWVFWWEDALQRQNGNSIPIDLLVKLSVNMVHTSTYSVPYVVWISIFLCAIEHLCVCVSFNILMQLKQLPRIKMRTQPGNKNAVTFYFSPSSCTSVVTDFKNSFHCQSVSHRFLFLSFNLIFFAHSTSIA